MTTPIYHSIIEPLESRIAPAVLVNPLTVTYTDVDGDTVTISVSHGDLTGKVIFEGGFGDVNSNPQQLKQINLTSPAFAHANLTIAAVRQNVSGDGLANFGFLNAAGVVLGDVNLSGDVGKIVGGGMGNLTLHSLGNSSEIGAPDFNSAIKGSVGDVHFTGSVNKAAFAVKGTIGNVTVDGSIVGGNKLLSGSITASVTGNIVISGSVVGGGQPSTGFISVTGNLAGLTISSVLLGGGGLNSGRIYVGGNLGAVIVGTLAGGAGDGSGSVEVKGNLASFLDYNQLAGSSGKRSGSLIVHGSAGPISCNDFSGGSNLQSGFIQVDGNAGNISTGSMIGGGGVQSGSMLIKGGAGQIHAYYINGGSGVSSGSISVGGSLTGVDTGIGLGGGSGVLSGSIRATGLIGTVSIAGNLSGGAAKDSGSISSVAGLAAVTIGGNVTTSFGVGSGAISTNGDLGTVTVHGSVTGTAGHPVIISALGTNVSAPGGSSNATIDSLTVDGSASFLNVLGGYDVNRVAVNADAQIGTIQIGTTVTGSNFVAGARAGISAGVTGFGFPGTKAIAGGNAGILSRIAGVVIGGQSVSTTVSGDGFAVVAQLISGVSVNGAALTVAAGPNDDHGLSLGAANDFKLEEVA